MARRTRVNCKICHKFKGNEVCDSCYTASTFVESTTAIKLLAENVKLKKELEGFKEIGKTWTFFGVTLGLMFFSFIGAMGLGFFVIDVISYFALSKTSLTFNFEMFNFIQLVVWIFLILVGISLFNQILSNVYINTKDKKEEGD